MGNYRKDGRKAKKKSRAENGNTMVEVMVSLFVLGMLAAVFANIFLFSGRAAGRVEKRIAAGNRLIEQYYLGEDIFREKIGEGSFTFYPEEQGNERGGGRPFRLNYMEIYRYTGEGDGQGALYDVAPGG